MPDAPSRLATALADRYRLERELGQGGMATVYLAHDIKHDRQVAVKVLRPELAVVIGAERFLAEIKTTAALQHPYILPLFDSGAYAERDGGTELRPYYVMPFVEGESLRDRLAREKQLPIGDAVRIATEVAGALDYAHRRGVIHRDIKPENILLADGQALVTDFGIALAVTSAGGTRMTETGLSLGTPHYMSPEQAMGERTLDARTDIYALGCVCYEMLTGEPPFTGPTAQAIVAKVMTAEPAPPSSVRKTVPPAVDDAILTALAKLPADRFATAAEFAAALVGQGRGRPVPATGRPSRAVWAATTVTLALVAFLLGGRLLGVAPLPLEFGRSVKLTSERGFEIQPAISPDGRFVAYAAGTSVDLRIFVRQVSGGRPTRLTDDTVTMQTSPTWSPDGTRVLFLAKGAVFSAPASGGAARQEVPAGSGGSVESAAWSPDGKTIAYVTSDSLFLTNQREAPRNLGWILEASLCAWSPNGRLIACASGNSRYLDAGLTFGNLSPSRIVVSRVADGRLTTVSDSLSVNQSPVWSPDSRWLYFISNRHGPKDIYAVAVDRGGAATGPTRRLTTGLGAQSIALNADGKQLTYAVYRTTANVWSMPFPAHPPVTAQGATQVTRENATIEEINLSTDGHWLFYDSDLAGNSDLYRMALPDGKPERLTTDPSDEFFPNPSPDGREMAFHSWRSGSRDIYVQPLDGRPLQRVTATPLQEAAPSWSPDGSALTFSEYTPPGGIWIARRSPGGTWAQAVRRIGYGIWSHWSPDGRRLAFVSAINGGYLAVMPADSGAVKVLLDPRRPGGMSAEQPLWSPDGQTIYFKSHDAKGNASFWSIPASGGTPRLLVRFDDPSHPSFRPEWAMGGGKIYFAIQDRQSDVWVMELTPR